MRKESKTKATTNSDAKEVAIKVEGVNKTFKLPHEKKSSVKSIFVSMFHGERSYEKQQALKDISFEIKKGEFFGIVGRNGSGKSTLLKLLAGIYTPDSGSIQVNGKLTPFIELGVGFNPELTGRENVFLNGALLGFNRKEMLAMYDEIVEFAELEKFMDQKLKNYSSGMQVRLAFSIAIRAKTDILLLDEVLAVGDSAFQQKCFDYFEKIKKQHKTVVLVTHDMGAVKRFCDRALLIEFGDLKITGNPEDVANRYILDNMNAADNSKEDTNLSSSLKLLEVEVKSKNKLTQKDTISIDIIYELKEDVPIYLALSIMFNRMSLIEQNSRSIKISHSKKIKYKVNFTLPLHYFNTQEFSINVSIFKEENKEILGYISKACSFLVQNTGKDGTKGGPIFVEGVWSKRGSKT